MLIAVSLMSCYFLSRIQADKSLDVKFEDKSKMVLVKRALF